MFPVAANEISLYNCTSNFVIIERSPLLRDARSHTVHGSRRRGQLSEFRCPVLVYLPTPARRSVFPNAGGSHTVQKNGRLGQLCCITETGKCTLTDDTISFDNGDAYGADGTFQRCAADWAHNFSPQDAIDDTTDDAANADGALAANFSRSSVGPGFGICAGTCASYGPSSGCGGGDAARTAVGGE